MPLKVNHVDVVGQLVAELAVVRNYARHWS